MKIWSASYDSRHFSFDAFGATKDDAIRALVDGLDQHGRQYNLEPRWWEDRRVSAEDQFELREIELGVAYRDRDFVLKPH
jgi:hypothetical protein